MTDTLQPELNRPHVLKLGSGEVRLRIQSAGKGRCAVVIEDGHLTSFLARYSELLEIATNPAIIEADGATTKVTLENDGSDLRLHLKVHRRVRTYEVPREAFADALSRFAYFV